MRIKRYAALAAACAVAVVAVVVGPVAPATAIADPVVTRVTVIVKTGDRSGAGTDAGIHLQFESVSTCGRRELDDERDNFERNATDSFGPWACDFQAGGGLVGVLQKQSDGSAWYVEWIKIRETEPYFPPSEIICYINRWMVDGGDEEHLSMSYQCHQTQ